MIKKKRSATIDYLVFGILFGCCFPVISLTFDIFLNRHLTFSLASVEAVHMQNPLHFIIDTAPLFLGIAFGIAGFYLDKANRYNRELEVNAAELSGSNIRLREMMENIKETQSLLVRSEKLAGLGQMTAGIAHEIKNPLNFITNFSEVTLELLDEVKASADQAEKEELLTIIQENVGKIRQHGTKVTSIVNNMLNQSRQTLEEKELAYINGILDESIGFSFTAFTANYRNNRCVIVKQFTETLKPLMVVRIDFERVIINLINNALYSSYKKQLAEGGSFVPTITVSSYEDNFYQYISVKDNGIGIRSDVKEKLFTPFFTTKPSGEGTGLGLSMSHNIIVKVHHGEITVNSVENDYAEFIIKMPVMIDIGFI